ncbi:Ankyrin repeat domain-containing protein 17 [Madurella mycetomatis]|uniref:Ankyrin repeat domain-containing protein 17 n=1 Tax=Madurella mycetomatis TaxID=100816 RepID=A0A175VNB1_9PEZI|nr:Ankyrin repeat domain-containing protein 17 [Madurella mycetomatis]KXX74241.1 Ankyrin repeat domain-containing protein 17 [Madurella mycetomatis]
MDELSGFVSGMPELRREIVNTIINASGGMFLLAELYLTFLEDKTTPAEVRETLVQFRGEGNARVESSEDEKREVLSRAYDRVTRRIDSQKKGLQKLARRVLTWVFRARRPLTETELRHALGVQPGTTAVDEQNVQLVENMVSVCMGLVTVDVESGTIRFIHATANTPPTLILDPNEEPTIAAICVSYLSFAAFSENPPSGFLTQQDLCVRCEEHPFYEYAATYWGQHARESCGSAKTDELILDFLDLRTKRRRRESVSAEIEVEASSQSEDDTPERTEDGEALDTEAEAESEAKVEVIEVEIPMRLTAAHLIAHLGLKRHVSAFLDGRPMDGRDFAGMSPLIWAARGGHEAVVDLLVASHGVDAEAADNQGRTPLLWAMWFGGEAVVERLLGSGRVSPESHLPAKLVLRGPWDIHNPMDGVDAVDEFFFWSLIFREQDVTFHLTPLAWAAFIGHQSLVQVMLTAMRQREEQEGVGADVLNARDPKYGRTPLWWAVRHGHRGTAQLLLETDGVNPDAQDNRLQSPLARAAVNGQAELVELLLRSGGDRIDLNSKDKYGLTPLCSAASYGKKRVVRLLLAQPGIELNPREEGGSAPLLNAAENGCTGTVEMILAQDGVAVNPRDGDGCMPLLVAARHGHAGVVRLFLATDGVDLDAADKMDVPRY